MVAENRVEHIEEEETSLHLGFKENKVFIYL